MFAPFQRIFDVRPRLSHGLVHLVLLALFAALPAVLFLQLSWRWPALRELIGAAEPHSAKLIGLTAVIVALGAAVAARLRLPGLSARLPRHPLLRLAVCYSLMGASIIAFTLPLISLRTAAPADGYMIGGMLPLSDAKGYYQGASQLLVQGKLDAWNNRRPLNASLLAARLAICGNHLLGSLSIQAAMLALAALALARAVARDFGSGAGLLVFAMMYAVGREHVGSTLSEALGLTLGMLAATLLWLGARDRRELVAAAGLLMLTLALNARAGAFFALPALVLWAGFALRRPERWLSWRATGLAGAAVVAGFLLNGSLLWLYGGGFGMGHGNFAHTLYGLSTGRADWTRVYRDYPECASLDERAGNAFIHAKAMQRIRQRPQDLVMGYIAELGRFGAGLQGYWKSLVDLTPSKLLNRLLRLWLLVFTARFLWVYRRDTSCWLLMAANLGLLLSGPIIWHDGGTRVLVASLPLFLLLFVIGVGVPRGHAEGPAVAPRRPAQGGAAFALALSAALVLLALVGPALGHWSHEAHLVPPPAGSGASSLLVRIGPGTPYLEILPADADESTFAPRIKQEDLARYVATHEAYFPDDLADQVYRARMMTLVYNLRADDPAMWYVLGPPQMITGRWRWLELSGEVHRSKELQCFVVSDYRPFSNERPVRARLASGEDSRTTR